LAHRHEFLPEKDEATSYNILRGVAKIASFQIEARRVGGDSQAAAANAKK